MFKSLRNSMFVLAALATACGGTDLEPYQSAPGRVSIPPVSGNSNALSAVSGCDNLLGELRDREADIMSASIEANREYALRVTGDRDGNCYDPNDDGCGFMDLFCSDVLMSSGEDRAAPPNANTTEGAQDYSTTNNQVTGVDEADYVKNDANYIYMTADDRLLIFEAWPAESTRLLANVELTGEPERIFVDGNRLVVLADTGDSNACGWDPYYGSFATAQTLQITVWDITDPSAPLLERRTQVSGSFVAARMISGVVHTVVEFADVAAAPLETWPDELPKNLCNDDFSRGEVNDAFDALLETNLAVIQTLALANFLPGFIDENLVDGSVATVDEELFTDCEDFYAPDQALAEGYLSLLSFPTHDDAVMGATTIFGRFGEVYASHENLYVAVKEFVTDPGEGWQWGWWGSEEHTLVHKFALGADGDAAVYSGSGSVPGTIINQFAMDEHSGRLRIATTEWSWDRSNNVFVLEDVGGQLIAVGEVRNIAPSEDIRSVRFDGDRGFMVTFQQTDPLFTFDLSDPYAPRVVGELHIPGFSTYIHFMDAEHLLTIGFDATSNGQFQGVMLQIFDVTNMAAPSLSHREVIGTRGTMSDATDDHLAFNYFPSRNALAIPMAICEGNGFWDEQLTFNGLMVYNVTAQDGFDFIGGVDHRDGTTNSNCGNWWTDPDSQVKRSVFMEDYVYSFSNTKLKVSSLDDVDSPFLTFNLPASEWQGPPMCDSWGWGWME